MTQPPIATDIHQPLDIHLTLSPKLAFYQILIFNETTDLLRLLFSPFTWVKVVVNPNFLKDLLGQGTTNAKNGR